MIEKSKSLDCNDYLFEDVNPELKKKQSGKNELLKFQLLFNMS